MRDKKKTRVSFFSCILISFLLGIEKVIPVIDESANTIQRYLSQMEQCMHPLSYTMLVVMVLLFVLFYKIYDEKQAKLMREGFAIGFICAFMLALGESYYQYNSWVLVFGSKFLLGMTVLSMLGFACAFMWGWMLLNRFLILYQTQLEGIDKETGKRMSDVLLVVGLLLAWLPYMILLYPGCFAFDTTDQIAQIVGNVEHCTTAKRTVNYELGGSLWNNHHPVFQTWLLSLFVKLGSAIHNYNIAFALYCLLQMIAMAICFVYFIQFLKSQGISQRVRRGMYLFYALCPIFPLWGMSIFKDTMFAVLLGLTVIYIYQFLIRTDPLPIKGLLYGMVLFLLVMLIRNNGFYILLFMLPVLVVMSWKQKKKMIQILLIGLLPLFIYKVVFTGWIFSAYHIGEGSVREMMSIPLQQTARYVVEHEEDVTKEERHILTQIFRFRYKNSGEKAKERIAIRNIKKRYRPARADNIKRYYNKYATRQDMLAYVSLWRSQLMRHPETYVEAFLNMNYPWIYPHGRYAELYYNGICHKAAKEMLPGLENPEQLQTARNTLNTIISKLQKMPVVSWIFAFSSYVWLLIFSIVLLGKQKKYKEIIALGFLILNQGICFIGPVAYLRYALPLFMTAPIMIGFVLKRREE